MRITKRFGGNLVIRKFLFPGQWAGNRPFRGKQSLNSWTVLPKPFSRSGRKTEGARLMPSGRLHGICAFVCALAVPVALLAAAGTDPGGRSIPPLMLPSTAGWTAFVMRGSDPASYIPTITCTAAPVWSAQYRLARRPKVTAYLHARTFNEYMPPASGIGPIIDGPEHPVLQQRRAARDRQEFHLSRCRPEQRSGQRI